MGINSKTIDELLKKYLNSLSQEQQIKFIKSVDEYSKLPILEQLKADCERLNKGLGQNNDKSKNCPLCLNKGVIYKVDRKHKCIVCKICKCNIDLNNKGGNYGIL